MLYAVTHIWGKDSENYLIATCVEAFFFEKRKKSVLFSSLFIVIPVFSCFSGGAR